jgi:predicted DNA-binding antitoxin AbrB/MazE fold protein
MIGEKVAVIGIFRDGVVVPEQAVDLPEGTRVEILLPTEELPEELEAEFAAWDRAGADAWAMIDELEREEAEKA